NLDRHQVSSVLAGSRVVDQLPEAHVAENVSITICGWNVKSFADRAALHRPRQEDGRRVLGKGLLDAGPGRSIFLVGRRSADAIKGGVDCRIAKASPVHLPLGVPEHVGPKGGWS